MKRNIISIVSVIIFALITSCDDNEDFGGDTRDFHTVTAYGAYGADAYTADVAVGEDTSSPPDGTCDVYSYFDDDVSIAVTSTAKDHTDDASSIKLMHYTVEFIPHEDSPDVPDKEISHHFEIKPNTTVDIPIRIIDQEDKFITSTHPLNHNDYMLFGDVSYEYTIRVYMKMEEVSSGDKETIVVEFPLYYFDVDDGCI